MNRFSNLCFAARGWILAALFAGVLWSRVASEAPLRPEFLALTAAALLLRLWAGAHLGPHGNGSRPEAPALATTGPYAFSRNPLYLSNITVGASLILFSNSLPALAVVILIALLFLHHALIVRAEETRLRALCGEAYEAYRRAVPRWFSFRPPEGENETGAAKKHASLRATFSLGFARQARNLAYALAAAALLATATLV